MARPSIKVGDTIKVYRGPIYGREDALAVKVDDATGLIDAVIIKTEEIVRDLIYSGDLGDTPHPTRDYWTELPEGEGR